jgi:hypothetical protein
LIIQILSSVFLVKFRTSQLCWFVLILLPCVHV